MEHKNIPYEYVPVNLLKNEQASAEYLKVNPSAAVPSLQVDGHIITQSVAILEYLEETWPQRPLLPQDPIKRAIVRQAVQVIAADTQPLQNLRVLRALGPEGEGRAWALSVIERGLSVFDALIASEHGGKYCVGDEITLADIVLVPQLYNARRFAVDLAKFPRLLAIEDRLSRLPEFARAAPEQQPDCPKD